MKLQKSVLREVRHIAIGTAACATVQLAVFALLGGRIPFCTVVSVELTVGLWSRLLLKSAKYRTMKAVCSMPTPTGAVRKGSAWHGTDCIFRVPGDRAAFTAGRREALRAHLHAGRRAADAGAFRAGRAPQRA